MTASVLTIHGVLQVTGAESSAMISGTASLGHILLAVAMILLLLALGKSIATSNPAPRLSGDITR